MLPNFINRWPTFVTLEAVDDAVASVIYVRTNYQALLVLASVLMESLDILQNIRNFAK